MGDESSQIAEPVSPSADAKAIIRALNSGWILRGFMFAIGFSLFGIAVWIVAAGVGLIDSPLGYRGY